MPSKYAFDVEKKEHFFRYPHLYRMEPFCIWGNLYYVGNQDVGAHLVDTGDGLVLVDTTYPTTGALLVQSIWELGFNPRDLKYILHTHGHFDHFGATGLLVSLSGAKTFLGREDAVMFRERPELALIEAGKYAYLEPFPVDVELGDGDVVALGNTQIRAVSTPGHTDGTMSFFITVTDGRQALVAGMFGGAGLNTLCRPFMEQYGITGCRERFAWGLGRVRDEHVDITLGNHAPQNDTAGKRERLLASPGGPNPFIDREEWAAFIDSRKQALEQMLADEAAGTDMV